MKIASNPVSFQNGNIAYKITKKTVTPTKFEFGNFVNSEMKPVKREEFIEYIHSAITGGKKTLDSISQMVDDLTAIMQKNIRETVKRNGTEERIFTTRSIIGSEHGGEKILDPDVVLHIQEQTSKLESPVLYAYRDGETGTKPNLVKAPINALESLIAKLSENKSSLKAG